MAKNIAFLLLAVLILQSEDISSIKAEERIERDDVLAPSALYRLILQAASRRLLYLTRGRLDRGAFDLRDFSTENALRQAIIKSYTAAPNGDNCRRDMEQIYNASTTGQKWAATYLDSMAARPSGLLAGNFRWYGEFDQCRRIGRVTTVSNNTISPKYCRLGLGRSDRNSTSHETFMPSFLSLTLGVCVSSTCQVETIADALNPFFNNVTMSIKPQMSRCLEDEIPYTGVSIFTMFASTLIVFSVLALFLLTGLMVDIVPQLADWLENIRHRTAENTFFIPPEEENVLFDGGKAETRNYAAIDHNQAASRKLPLSAKWDWFVKVAMCFSPYTNFIKLITLPYNESKEVGALALNLTAINGIRTLSLFWVILGHVYVFLAFSYDNLLVATEWMDRTSFMFVIAGYYAVDSFLFLSGFLAYWSLENKLRPGGGSSFWKTLPFIYLNRYVRLFGPYLAIILIDLGLWAHLSTGPFYFQGVDYSCINNWWANLLYVNNLVYVKEQCVPWTWYLGVDMQLFLVTPFIVYLFNWRPRYGWFACIGALIGQAVIATSLTFGYNLPSSINQPFVLDENATDTKDYRDYFEIMYVKPYTRLGPYIVGLLCAHVGMNHAFQLSRKVFGKVWVSSLMWAVMFALMLTLTYAQHGVYAGKYVDPPIVDALYNSFARTAWGLALAWLVLACAFKQAGPIGGFLAWPFWSIPARLSYCAYLLHPLVILFYGETSRRPFHGTDLTNIFMFCATILATLLVSIIHSLAFESPIIALQRLFLKKSKP